MEKYILYYFLIISFITFIIFGIDKYKAIKNKWRIKERTLIMFSFLGGSFGAFLAMFVFRHKIRKPKFYILVPISLILHITLMVYYKIYI